MATAVGEASAQQSPVPASAATPAPTVEPAGPTGAPEPTDGPVEWFSGKGWPAWVYETTWIIYPEGTECWGTEGCGNDYRAWFGEPGEGPLPDNVVMYDEALHGRMVHGPDWNG